MKINYNYKEMLTKITFYICDEVYSYNLSYRLSEQLTQEFQDLFQEIITICRGGIKNALTLKQFSYTLDRFIDRLINIMVSNHKEIISEPLISEAIMIGIYYLNDRCLREENYEFLHNLNGLMNQYNQHKQKI